MIGQEPGMWHLTDEDGLPSMTVYETAQDNQGYIWMGTERGVCRFDGKGFKYYESPDFNDSEILSVIIDKLNRVWFRNLAGQFFYIEEEIIYSVKELFPDELPKDSFDIQGFTIYENEVWFSMKKESSFYLAYLTFDDDGNNSPISFFDEKFNYLSSFVHDEKSANVVVNELSDIEDYFLIPLTTDNDQLKKGKVMSTAINRNLKNYYQYNDLWYVFQNVGSVSEIITLKDGQTSSFLKFKSPNSINNFKVIENEFWLLTPKGILIKPLIEKGIIKEDYLLGGISTNHLMVDDEGNKWISTTGQGVYVINSPEINIFKINNFDLPSNKVYSLAYDPFKNKMLVGHDNGLISIINNQQENQIISLKTSGRFIDLLVDDIGHYWCANDRGLFVIDEKLDIEQKLHYAIKSIYETSKNDFLINSYCCSFLLPIDEIKILNPMNSKGVLKKITDIKSYAFLEDFSENIWIGTIKGIQLYKNTEASPFLENEKQIPYNVSTLQQASDSVIWVGTRGDGLIGIKNEQVIARYNQSDGLASSTVKSLVVTDDVLWIGTDNGLNKLNLKTKSWEWIHTADGLPSNEINDIEIVNDVVWIGTAKGLVNFSVHTNYANNYPPPIYITNIKIEEKDTTIQDTFFLSYDQNSLQIDFIGIGFRGKGEGSYEFKLSGVDDDWVKSKTTFTRYPNLSPGEYTFEVYALNEDLLKSKESKKIFFSISPPWWKMWWFRLLVFVTFLTLVTLVIKTRVKRRQRDQFFINQVKELQANALRSQMNPHFVFNSLNAIQQFLTTNNREQAMIYLSRFGKLIRMIFEQSQKEKITLEEELEFLKLYLNLEQLRFMDRVEIKINVSEDLEEMSEEIYIPPLLIQPVIENSFKHGFMYKEELGILKIEFSYKDTSLICTIEDNGIGRKKAAELGQKELKDRPSSGLTTARERLKINNQVLEKSKVNPGIKITDLYEEGGTVSGTLVKVNIFCEELKIN